MRVNGKIVDYEQISVQEYLLRHEYNPLRVVVERNKEIITRDRFSATALLPDDEINILHFMGGG
ncbi:MAG: sulfur carrier protein ThiS [Oscillospiraceae bacterium]|jgi:sulfur carrier protein|nr:sulfur carrier protein ThiS [Oscillospiraceae bacterium]